MCAFYFDHDSDYEVVAFTVDGAVPRSRARSPGGRSSPYEEIARSHPPDSHELFVAVSYQKMNQVRAEKYGSAKAMGYSLARYVSSKAITWPTLSLGDNTFVMEANVVQPFATDRLQHDTVVGQSHRPPFAHRQPLLPGVAHRGLRRTSRSATTASSASTPRLRDGIRLAERCLIGAGATVMQGHEARRGLRAEQHRPESRAQLAHSRVSRRRANAVGEEGADLRRRTTSTSGWRTTPLSRSPTRSTIAFCGSTSVRVTAGADAAGLHRRRGRQPGERALRPRSSCPRSGQAWRLRRQRRDALVHRQRRRHEVPVLLRLESGRDGALQDRRSALAVSTDGGMTFDRLFEGPIVDRTRHEPYFCSTPFVLVDDGHVEALVRVDHGLRRGHGRQEPQYQIRYAESTDGIETGAGRLVTCIGLQLRRRSERAGRACSRRTAATACGTAIGASSTTARIRSKSYRIGYAESVDGRGLDPARSPGGHRSSEDGWDSMMVAYPFVYEHRGTKYMLYAGNGFGETGFGYAVLEDDDRRRR